MKRSVIRGIGVKAFPDYAALHPGYITAFNCFLYVE
jgi:hypothetical protein